MSGGYRPVMRRIIKSAIHKNRLAGLLYDNYSLRTVVFAYGALGVNAYLALTKGAAGWYFGSDWLSTLAMYYLLLCVIRFTLLRASRKVTALTDQDARMRKEWKACRVCGEVFMGMTVILMGIVVLITAEGFTFAYDGLLIYAVAAYDFFCLTKAIIYMGKNRKNHTPLIVAIKSVNLAAALVSILSLQTAMFAAFGSDMDTVVQTRMNLATGAAVCMMIFLFGFFMAVHSKKQMKALITGKTNREAYQ